MACNAINDGQCCTAMHDLRHLRSQISNLKSKMVAANLTNAKQLGIVPYHLHAEYTKSATAPIMLSPLQLYSKLACVKWPVASEYPGSL